MNRRTIIIISAVAVLATLVLFLIFRDNSPSAEVANEGQDQSTETSLPSDEQISNEDQTPQADETPVPDFKKPPSDDDDPDPPSNDGSRTVTITRATVSGDNLTVAAIVDGAESDDTCTLVMAKNGYSDQSFTNPVVFQSSYYSCKNFQIDTNKLPTKGEWSIFIQINGGSQGESDAQTVSV
ncbi:MAG: hypothetical protein R3313_01150 [Candidatus Saccharimonadales bacterium]|nr:hypothetical protein [Candidatus Saccharimonadales bacterium]